MSSLFEVLRALRRGPRIVLSCPICGSVLKKSRAPLEGWILPVRYVCTNCNYSGFIGMEKNLEDIVAES